MYPKIAEIGPFVIRSYGFLLMIAFIVGILWTMREARRRARPVEHVVDLSLIILISSIISARIVYVLLNLSDYLENPIEMLTVWRGGLSFHGGLGGAMLASTLYIRRQKLNFWQMADLFIVAVPLGYAIAKIGCFLNGCCYGYPTQLPWAFRFASEGIPDAPTPASHPAQLYDAAANLILFFVVNRLKKNERPPGYLFAQYAVGYSLVRIFIETFRRGVTARQLFPPITEAQFASLLIILWALFFIRKLTEKSQVEGETP